MEGQVALNDTTSKFRSLVKQISGKEITSVQAEQFLGIFQEELDLAIVKATKDFIGRHFGWKGSQE